MNTVRSVTGIDLSMTSTGVAWIGADGDTLTRSVTSKGKATDDLEARATRIRRLTEDIAYQVPFGELVVIESPSFGSAGAGTWDRSGLWWSVVLFLMDENSNGIAMVAPTTLKKWLTGSGRAEKNTVGVHVGRLFPTTEIKTDDEADALGLAHLGACKLGLPVSRLAIHNDKALAEVKAQWPRELA